MRRRISKSEMRSYMKELRAISKELGCSLKVFYKPIVWNRYGGNGPNFSEVNGYYAGNWKEIVVRVYGRPARRKVLHAVAHEIRHAQHDAQGLFPDYYRSDLYKLYTVAKDPNKKLPKRIKRPCNRTAFLAENDCNRWADKFLNSKNVKGLKEKYSYSATWAYRINSAISTKRLR